MAQLPPLVPPARRQRKQEEQIHAQRQQRGGYTVLTREAACEGNRCAGPGQRQQRGEHEAVRVRDASFPADQSEHSSGVEQVTGERRAGAIASM